MAELARSPPSARAIKSWFSSPASSPQPFRLRNDSAEQDKLSAIHCGHLSGQGRPSAMKAVQEIAFLVASSLSFLEETTRTADPFGAQESAPSVAMITVPNDAQELHLRQRHETGELIVEFAGQKIANTYDFTFALNALKIGHPVKIIVLRGGERVDVTVVPEAGRRGNELGNSMPEESYRYWLTFSAKQVRQPLIREMSRKHPVIFAIRSANVGPGLGLMAIELTGNLRLSPP